jgi:hypothetical protein
MQSFKDGDRDGQHGDDTSSCMNTMSLFTDFPKVLQHWINLLKPGGFFTYHQV